ncbi:hypothetical protein B0H14DRAFT_3886468 [Mycena olivaceomarginata]|nr:hypothetical protein B0H14DRAFT_3886468 [Mycena olivaceomarginata]
MRCRLHTDPEEPPFSHDPSRFQRRHTTSHPCSLSAAITDLALMSTSSTCAPRSVPPLTYFFRFSPLPSLSCPSRLVSSRLTARCQRAALVRGLALRVWICQQAWSRNPPGAYKPSHPAFVLHLLPFSSNHPPCAARLWTHTTVRAARLAALHLATLRAIVPEATRRHTQANNTATPLTTPCAWDLRSTGLACKLLTQTLGSSPDLRSRARAARPRLIRFLPWTRSERADINNTDVCSGVRGIIVLERVRTNAQRPRTCPSPTRSAPLLSSTFAPLSKALCVSTPLPASLLLLPVSHISCDVRKMGDETHAEEDSSSDSIVQNPGYGRLTEYSESS